MSLTRVTQVVMSSNAISTEKIANATIITRHVAGGAITSDKLGANANLGQIIANINIVSANAGGTDTVQDNLTTLTTNVIQNFYNVGAYLNMDETITVDATNSNVTIGEHFSRTSNTRTLPFSRLTVLGNTEGELISFSRGDANTKVRGAIGYHNDSVFIGNRATSDNARLDLRVGGVDSAATDTLMSLLPTGKVGIGTLVPSHNFDVRGTANVLSLAVSDDVNITGNLTVLGQTTTVNSISLIIQDRMIALANSQPVGSAPTEDVGIFFNRGNQGNAAFFYDESAKAFAVADTKDPFTNTAISIVTRSNLNVGLLDTTTLKLGGTLITSDAGEINKLDGVTASTAEINHLEGVSGDIQTQLDLKDTKANVSATFIQLTANLNATTGNVNIVQDNVSAITGGATLLNPFQNVNTATGSSNVFFIGKAVPADKIERVVVSISGVNQAIDQPGTSNNDYIVHHANNTVQFTAPTIPSGEKIVIHAFH